MLVATMGMLAMAVIGALLAGEVAGCTMLWTAVAIARGRIGPREAAIERTVVATILGGLALFPVVVIPAMVAAWAFRFGHVYGDAMTSR
jgi:hypothetical protein